jgi:hypothetical protein
VLLLVPTVVRASAKPFWHDELYTVLLARLPSLSAHWQALHDGPDLAPPLNAFATRAAQNLVGVGHVSSRVPPMAGFWIMTLAIHEIVRRRSNATLALSAAFIPLFTTAFRYAAEARPYGLMIGLAAAAWLAWCEAAAGRRRMLYLPMLGVSLAAGLWNHYFAALAYVPIAVGESVRVLRDKRIDTTLWAVVIGSMLALLPLIRLIRVAALQAPTFWSRPSLDDIGATYTFLFGGFARSPLGGIVAALAIAAAVVSWRQRETSRTKPLPPHELAAAIACLLIPVFGVVLALLLTGAYIPRYGMTTVIAVCVVVPLFIGRAERRMPLAGPALLVAMVAAYGASLPGLLSVQPFESPFAARPLLAQSLQMPGATVASGQLWYLQLWFYAPAALKPRFVYLADPSSAVRYGGAEMIDRGYLALARWVPLRVEPCEGFLRNERGFRIYAAGTGWLLDRLQTEHADVHPLGSEPGGQLYDVTLAPARPRGGG